MAINSLEQRFNQLESHSQLFEFLYDIPALKSKDSKDILKLCQDLHVKLTDDIDPIELHNEILILREIVQNNKYSTPLEILTYLEKKIIRKLPQCCCCITHFGNHSSYCGQWRTLHFKIKINQKQLTVVFFWIAVRGGKILIRLRRQFYLSRPWVAM